MKISLKATYAPYASIDIGALDAEGKSLIWRTGDLRARFMLIDLAEYLYDADQKLPSCTVIHAYTYLADRLAYELYPWPKGCVPANFGQDEMSEVSR